MSNVNDEVNMSELEIIQQYPNSELLTNVCKSFEEQEILLTVTFMGKNITICNCNAVGDILEDIFYPIIKDKLDDFEEGPKQASPDYFGMNKHFEFEQKVFMKSPGFDIGNFTSYVNMLCEDGGVYKKLFKTTQNAKLINYFQSKTRKDFKNSKEFFEFYPGYYKMKSDKKNEEPIEKSPFINKVKSKI